MAPIVTTGDLIVKKKNFSRVILVLGAMLICSVSFHGRSTNCACHPCTQTMQSSPHRKILHRGHANPSTSDYISRITIQENDSRCGSWSFDRGAHIQAFVFVCVVCVVCLLCVAQLGTRKPLPLPCVGSKRLRVYRQNARMLNTCARFAGTHRGVLNLHMETF